jgi:hypothetical protein
MWRHETDGARVILEVVFVAALIVTAFLSGVLYEARVWDRDVALGAELAKRQAERDAFAAKGFVPHTSTDMASGDAEYSADGTRL